MRRLAVFLAGLAVAASGAAAEYYRLTGVRKVATDLYRCDGGILVETRWCYHEAWGEDAILKWEGDAYAIGNMITFADGESCDVVRLR